MNIDLTRLRSGVDKFTAIDLVYSFDKDMLNRNGIKSLNDVTINGTITRNSLDDYVLDVNVKGTAVLTCAITLADVPYEFDIIINDELLNLYEESSINVKNIGNTIDILPIIWENILMEIPTYIVSPGASSTKIEGNGWSLNKDNLDKGNSELSKLKELF